MKSVWAETKQKKFGKSLTSNIQRDIVIVGGGIAGVLAAYFLTESGKKVTLIEAGQIFGGVTHNTTAHITAQQGYIYSELAKNRSIEFASLYYKSQMQAIEKFENLVKKLKIDCDFERVDDYLFTIEQPKKLKKLYDVLTKVGANVKYSENKEILGFPVKAVIQMRNQAMFHPIKFLNGLNLDFEIFENTRILEVDLNKKILYTANHNIIADKIIIATNYPIINLKGTYFLKLYKSQSYSVITNPIKNIKGMYQGDLENGITLRNSNNQIIIGGLDHRTGRNDSEYKFEQLEDIAKKYFEKAKILNRWSANDTVTFDGLAITGLFSKKYKDIYIITGFNKWGMANSMASAQLITDIITEKKNIFEEIFSPQRFMFSLSSFFISLGVSIKNLIKPLLIPLNTHKKLKADTGGIVWYNFRKRAVYKDAQNKLHICSPFCKHMGCQLTFNANTKTWDCPCHGSRFDIDGQIITAPTVKPLDKIPQKNKK
ncbi:MAG: FAD-dependent oxidoreductase [Clostridia bacterium]|nr:FAD-dependent oxidoreductase [Clostridia bacterium]